MCIVFHITVSLFVMEMKIESESEMYLFDPYKSVYKVTITLYIRSFADKFKPAPLRLLYTRPHNKLMKPLTQGASTISKVTGPTKTLAPNVRDQRTIVHHIHSLTKIIRARP